MAVQVRCRNRNCDNFNSVITIPAALGVAEGENIYCGGCGHPTRFIGAERPTKIIPWQDGMNTVQPFVEMDDADL